MARAALSTTSMQAVELDRATHRRGGSEETGRIRQGSARVGTDEALEAEDATRAQVDDGLEHR
jgi:hypothetical protein